MSHLRRCLVIALVVAFPSTTLLAQQSSGDVIRAATASVVSDAPVGGPRLSGTQVGVRAHTQQALRTESVRQPDGMRRRGVPHMIIGGVALIVGGVIGNDAGTIVMLGGLGVGLYGLYLFLQ